MKWQVVAVLEVMCMLVQSPVPHAKISSDDGVQHIGAVSVAGEGVRGVVQSGAVANGEVSGVESDAAGVATLGGASELVESTAGAAGGRLCGPIRWCCIRHWWW